MKTTRILPSMIGCVMSGIIGALVALAVSNSETADAQEKNAKVLELTALSIIDETGKPRLTIKYDNDLKQPIICEESGDKSAALTVDGLSFFKGGKSICSLSASDTIRGVQISDDSGATRAMYYYSKNTDSCALQFSKGDEKRVLLQAFQAEDGRKLDGLYFYDESSPSPRIWLSLFSDKDANKVSPRLQAVKDDGITWRFPPDDDGKKNNK